MSSLEFKTDQLPAMAEAARAALGPQTQQGGALTDEQIDIIAESVDCSSCEYCNQRLYAFTRAIADHLSAQQAGTVEPRLPHDVKVGHTTFRKGVTLSTFVGAAQRWHRAAYPYGYTLTDEQKAENLRLLQACATPKVNEPSLTERCDAMIEKLEAQIAGTACKHCASNDQTTFVFECSGCKARHAAIIAAENAEIESECDLPPFGWRCTRGKGHEGPCAAVECPEDIAGVERGMQRYREGCARQDAALSAVQDVGPLYSTRLNAKRYLHVRKHGIPFSRDVTYTDAQTDWLVDKAMGLPVGEFPAAGQEDAEAMRMLWDDQPLEEKEHYRRVVREAQSPASGATGKAGEQAEGEA